MNDDLAKKVEGIWKNYFPDASILPVIGMPSNSNGVMTLTHTGGKDMGKLKINGLTSNSPLANNALYSAEMTKGGKWLNLYEVMFPDIPGKNGCPSTGEIYCRTLNKLGITVAGNHYHWLGMEPFMLAIHTQAIGMDPETFSKRTAIVLTEVMKIIKENNGKCYDLATVIV